MTSGIQQKGSELIAKRWAKALMDLAGEEGGVSKEDILANLRDVNENISSSKELAEMLVNPVVSQEEKLAVLTKLFQSRVMPMVFNFLTVLNSKNRLGYLAAITDEFQRELEELKNIVRVSVTSAIDLSEDKKNSIRNRLAEKLQKDVIPEWFVDSGIIGGLIFNINETIVDNSIRHRLENLGKQIIKG